MMGLDMYLTGNVYLSDYDEKEKALKQKLKEEFSTQYEPSGIEFQIMYWRKANAIHKWFVQNVQDGRDDCGTYYVTEQQLKELLETAKNALKSDSPETVLPTQEGFFFGSYEYDEGYREDLEQTIHGLEKFLEDKNKPSMDLYYHSSW